MFELLLLKAVCAQAFFLLIFLFAVDFMGQFVNTTFSQEESKKGSLFYLVQNIAFKRVSALGLLERLHLTDCSMSANDCVFMDKKSVYGLGCFF